MSPTLPEAVVRFLTLCDETVQAPLQFDRLGSRQWESLFDWLDSAGLTLYFLHALTERRMLGAVPLPVLRQLEQRQHDNSQRIAIMAQTFALLNQRFIQAGVKHAVLKGFSLVPDYCPDPCLRPMSDLDYLVAENSLDEAQRILTQQGYVLKKQNGAEYTYWVPSIEPTKPSDQYSQLAPFAIELHLSVLNPEVLDIPFAMPEISCECTTAREWNGSVFPALLENDIFLAQVAHVFRHMMQGGVRLSWLLEIGHFFKQHERDTAFWNEFERSITLDSMLTQVSGLVAALTAKVFGGPLPPSAMAWVEQLRPATRLWIDFYAQSWVLESCGPPRSKLFGQAKVLIFLKGQFIVDAQTRKAVRRRSLYPWARLRRLLRPPSAPGTTISRALCLKTTWLFSRTLYHLGTNLRYFWETFRWRRVKKHTAALKPIAGTTEPSTLQYL